MVLPGPRAEPAGEREWDRVRDRGGGRLAGVIDLKRTDWRARTTEIGYWAAPWARGRGVIRRAVSRLSRWAIEDLGFLRLEIRVATENIDSQRVAEAAGFVREGVLRNAGYVHAGRVDLIVYSLVDADLRGEGA
ncbi:MAG: GNAT family N-acetyltransferase [Chloroflexi bacterium]|nr:GNAT family N-acetyltransferase [Chloroflexota bacterium]